MSFRLLIAFVATLMSGYAFAFEASQAPHYEPPDMYRSNVDQIIIRSRAPHSPTANPTAGPLHSTLAGINLQGLTLSKSNREFMASFGLTSNLGADQPDAPGNGDKLTLYAGINMFPGSGNGWAFNTVTTRNPGVTKSSTGYELDMNNNDQPLGEALGEPGSTARPFGYGLIVTGAGRYRSTGAIEVSGPGGVYQWNRGLVINGNSVKQASFQDNTVADISIDVRGGHQYLFDGANAGVVKAAIRLPRASSIVSGKPDSGGAVDSSGDNALIGSDASGNPLLEYNASFTILGGALLPKTTTTNALGSEASRWATFYGVSLNLLAFTPASSSAPCEQGAMTADNNYIYRCVATNTWKRSALSSW